MLLGYCINLVVLSVLLMISACMDVNSNPFCDTDMYTLAWFQQFGIFVYVVLVSVKCFWVFQVGWPPSRILRDSPKNALKIPSPKSGLKYLAISQINYLFIKPKWQHCLAAMLRAHCATICTLGTVWKRNQHILTSKKLLQFWTWRQLSTWMNHTRNFV
jgi:hypothetical protein